MTTLPEEAVKAVVGVPVSGPYLSKAEAVEIIEAALPFLPVQGAVKKLEWDEDWCAKTPFGMYTVQENAEDTWSFTFYDYPYGIPEGEFGTLDEAKAAAQADFEARILSALEPSAARELALEEILREVDEVERKVWAWSGSAFLNNELEGAEDADCKTELYRELCGIGNTMHWLRTKICALSSPDHADAGKVEGDGSAAARDVLAERRRQIEAEGWTPGRDDEQMSGQLA